MNPASRLLLIDDDPKDRALAAIVLAAALPGLRIDQLDEDSSDLSAALGDGVFDVVVTDLETRSARGAFLVRMIRARQPRAAILIFTRTEDRDSAVAAMKAGAADYLIKSSAGFMQLGRSAGEALEKLRAAHRVARPVERPVERKAAVPSSSLDAPAPGNPVAPLPLSEEILPQPQLEPETKSEPRPEKVLEPAPEPDSEPDPLPLPTASTAHAAPTALRSAVERARRTVAAVPTRSLGAVLGIIAILAVFSLLAASFFVGDSETVEAQAVEAQAVEAPVVEAQVVRPPPVETQPIKPQPQVSRDLEAQPVETQPVAVPSPAVERDFEPDRSVQSVPDSSAVDPNRPAPQLEMAMSVVVRLEATAEVWVQGTTDGRQALDRVLAPGEVVEIRGAETATLLIGNAAGLRILWNGEDLGALGDQGQVRRLYFTPDRVGVGALPTG